MALFVSCRNCRAARQLDVAPFPNGMPLSWFKLRLRCNVCGKSVDISPTRGKPRDTKATARTNRFHYPPNPQQRKSMVRTITELVAAKIIKVARLSGETGPETIRDQALKELGIAREPPS
jgi:hypothetical protein